MKFKTNWCAIYQEKKEAPLEKTETINTASAQGRSVDELTRTGFSEETDVYSDFEIENDYLMLFDS